MMSISNTRLHLLLTLMQSEVAGNHACPLQLIRLYFPGEGRNTTETQKVLNSALLTSRNQ